MNNEEDLADFLKPNDVFILDRGFRDAIKMCNERGIRTLMPNLLAKGQKQFTTTEANDSRKVTLLRWVVEAVNGRLKKIFKFFDNVVPGHYFNENCQKLNSFLRISCAVMNKYCPPIYHDTEDQLALLAEIERTDLKENALMTEVMECQRQLVKKRVCWKKSTSADFEDFPRLSLPELHKLVRGKFSIKNARGYTDSHLRADTQYHVQLHRERAGLLRVKLGSKFRGSSNHLVWIEYSTSGDKKITGHYCQCMQGARTITPCGHITSILWFLGYQRHVNPQYVPRSFGQDIIDITAKKVQEMQIFGLEDSDTVDDLDDD